jgi:hypothetical protein
MGFMDHVREGLTEAICVEERPPSWFKDGGPTVYLKVAGTTLEIRRFKDEDDAGADDFVAVLRLALMEIVRTAAKAATNETKE